MTAARRQDYNPSAMNLPERTGRWALTNASWRTVAGPGVWIACAAWWVVLAGGCSGGPGWSVSGARPEPAAEGSVKIPPPVNYLLPKSVNIHPFTGMRTFDEAGGIRGIDVRVEAKDAFGDATKAFGKFIFQLYQFLPQNPNPKGKLIMTWEEEMLDPQKNLLHWNIHRTYEFKLLWDSPIPVGQKFVLEVIFSSPFTQRLTAERVFVSGQ